MNRYNQTILLPKTTFSMKADLAKKEPTLFSLCSYDVLRQKSANLPDFVLHFGPPYANGHIHIGHALSEILKDAINKTYQMKGFNAHLIPGWDCHGLPIEWKIEEAYRAKGLNKDTVPVLEFRQECRLFAEKWTAIQKEEFKRLGILADFDNAYSTMNFQTEAKIVAELGRFLMNKALYRGLKPVLWSVVEKTALAEAEVEYKDHTSDAVMVGFPIVSTNPQFHNVQAVIWTTTPWTLPANKAIAYHDDIEYVVIESDKGRHLVATERLRYFFETANITESKVAHILTGAQLKRLHCHHPLYGHPEADGFYDFDVPFLHGDHVTIDAGTGLVHTAPAHGLEDFAVCQKNQIAFHETVKGDGTYHDHVALFKGIHIFKANAPIIAAIKSMGRLVGANKLTHSYPHSWRSKAPLIYRATAQWFISMDGLRDKALEAIDNVTWFPAIGRNRIKSMVASRPDWCISRQRAWGTPITVFFHKETGDVLRDEKIHQRIVDCIMEEGGDGWFIHDAAYFLQDDYDATIYEKCMDIADVWFDSGCSHAFVIEGKLSWPCDLYVEGSDQHRGWFQSSLLHSCGTRGVAPYKGVVTHGFVLDEKGYKMSKSLGNTVTPKEIIDKYGADLLRLWVINSDYTTDLRIGAEILKRQEDIYRRYRNTLRYMLGALGQGGNGGHGDNNAHQKDIPYDQLPTLEQYMLNQLATLHHLHENVTQDYDFSTFYTTLHNFCVTDLSAFYFDIRKDVLYCEAVDSPLRQSALFTMDRIFNDLVRWLAPVLSFTAEEAYHHYQTDYKGQTENCESIHYQQFLTAPVYYQEIHDLFERIRTIRRVITHALEKERAAKTIGSSLEAHITLYLAPEYHDLIPQNWAELCIVSEVTFTDTFHDTMYQLPDVPGVGVQVTKSGHAKCERCWRHMAETRDLCQRCQAVVGDVI